MSGEETQWEGARYALAISGQQDESSISDNVFRFEARLTSLIDQMDLSTIHGLLIHHDGRGDFCVEILQFLDKSVHHKSVRVSQNAIASRQLEDGCDVQVPVHSRHILFLHTPRIEDISEERQPGTRLIMALQKHFIGRNLEVIIDLGLDEESKEFETYFFPGLDVLGVIDHPVSSGYGLKYAKWGNVPVSNTPFSFGIRYV